MPKNLNDIISGVALRGEMNHAAQRVGDEIDAREKAKQDASAAALAARQADEHAAFIAELKPLTDFVHAVAYKGLTDFRMTEIISDDDKIRVNTGFSFGIFSNPAYYKTIQFPVSEGIYLGGTNTNLTFMRNNSLAIDETKKAAKQYYLQIPELVWDSKTEFDSMGLDRPIISHLSTDMIDDAVSKFLKDAIKSRHSYNHENKCEFSAEEKRSVYKAHTLEASFRNYNVCFGREFQRGVTTPQDVNEFLGRFIEHLYERWKRQPEQVKKLRETIRKHFSIDLDNVAQSAHMLVVTKQFRALGNSAIIRGHENEVPALDLEILNRDQESIKQEINGAIDNLSPVAVLKIGQDLSRLSAALSSQLTRIILPQSDHHDYDLVQSIRRDIGDLSGETLSRRTGNSFGERLLSRLKFIRQDAIAETQDPSTKVSVNFAALATSLGQRLQTVEYRMIELCGLKESFDRLSTVIDSYCGALDQAIDQTTEAEKQADLKNVRSRLGFHYIATEASKTSLQSAVQSDKQAYIAIQQVSDTVPLMAVSLTQAILKQRATKTRQMLEASTDISKTMLSEFAGQYDVKPEQLSHLSAQDLFTKTAGGLTRIQKGMQVADTKIAEANHHIERAQINDMSNE